MELFALCITTLLWTTVSFGNKRVDTTAQYDAVRAYLKELDISSAVWVGLIRSNPDGDFTWTDYRGLSGDGYWSSAPDARSAPLCAAADPAADYRWEARACGGPSIASFICELPVPQWALGNEGCMVRALPALTVLYLPESAAVQLTADCGMAGVKRVQCIGNVKHEDLLRDLSCTEDDASSTATSIPSMATNWVTAELDQDNNDATIEENTTTEREENINTLNYISSTLNPLNYVSVTQKQIAGKDYSALRNDNAIVINKNVNLEIAPLSNVQSNDIPKPVLNNELHGNDQFQKQEDEKNMQHKLLHNELARLGNFENIFNQPTDHFIPPLVMAKAKVNDDMTPVSFEEKLAQQHTEYQLIKYENENNSTLNTNYNDDEVKNTTEVFAALLTTEVPITITSYILKDKKEINKNVLPKKYDHLSEDIKSKIKSQPAKFIKNIKLTISSQTETIKTAIDTTTLNSIVKFDPSNEDNSLDLTVIINEPGPSVDNYTMNFNVTNTPQYDTSIDKEISNFSNTQNIHVSKESNTESSVMENITLNDEIIKITFIHDDINSFINSTVFEVTTRTPIFKDNIENNLQITSPQSSIAVLRANTDISTTSASNIVTEKIASTPIIKIDDVITTVASNQESNNNITEKISRLEMTTHQYSVDNRQAVEIINSSAEVTSQVNYIKDLISNNTEIEGLDYIEKNGNDTSQYIDDFQSPLLSGASEPLHKPNRSRRPQQPNRIKKFNPFRILG